MTINGKFYKDVDLTFNTVCKIEDMGVPITSIGDNIMSAARAYVALCMRVPLEKAGEELESHVVAGGSMKEIIEIFNRKVDESGFFLALRKQTEEQEEAEELDSQPKPKKAENSAA